MARIPVVQEPSVRTEGLPTPYERPFATPQGQGAAFGDLLEQGAHVASQYVQEARQKADSANIQGAWGAGQDLFNKQILDPEKGYVSLRGDDAMKARDKVLGDYSKGLDAINGNLTPQQQQMFAPHLRALKEQGTTHVLSHESVEMERYAQGNFKGNIDSTMETMQNPTIIASPVDLKANVDKLYQASIDEGKRRFGAGASKEALSSVIDPALQTAALGGMQSALQQAEAAGDPTIAKNAYDVLGKYLLKNHQKQIGGMVEALTKKSDINRISGTLIGKSSESVMLPSGQQVARVDDAQFATETAKIPEDTPYYADIIKQAEARKDTLRKVWNGVTGTVVSRVETAAMAGGGFDLSKASTVDVEFLRQKAPDLLLKLQHEDTRGQTTESRLASAEAYAHLAEDMAAHPDVYKEMAAPEFTTLTANSGVSAFDRPKALKLFTDVQKGGLTEKINKTVSEQLADAFPGKTQSDAKRRADLQGILLDAASDFADRWKADTEGKVVPTKELRKFIDAELVKGKVRGSSMRFWPDDTTTRLEYQRNAKYRGLSFEPNDPTVGAVPQTPIRSVQADVAGFDALNRSPEAAQPVQAATPAAAPEQTAGTVAVTPAPAKFYRYTKDGSKRYPTDKDGKVIGPAEAVAK